MFPLILSSTLSIGFFDPYHGEPTVAFLPTERGYPEERTGNRENLPKVPKRYIVWHQRAHSDGGTHIEALVMLRVLRTIAPMVEPADEGCLATDTWIPFHCANTLLVLAEPFSSCDGAPLPPALEEHELTRSAAQHAVRFGIRKSFVPKAGCGELQPELYFIRHQSFSCSSNDWPCKPQSTLQNNRGQANFIGTSATNIEAARPVVVSLPPTHYRWCGPS